MNPAAHATLASALSAYLVRIEPAVAQPVAGCGLKLGSM